MKRRQFALRAQRIVCAEALLHTTILMLRRRLSTDVGAVHLILVLGAQAPPYASELLRRCGAAPRLDGLPSSGSNCHCPLLSNACFSMPPAHE